MSSPPDRPQASEALVCEVTGVSQSLRHNWVTRHGLRRQPRGCYEVVDAMELAALKAVLETLGPGDGAIAWKLIRTRLGLHWDRRPLVLLFDAQDKTAILATQMSQVTDALPSGRPMLAVRLDDVIGRAERAFLIAAPVM